MANDASTRRVPTFRESDFPNMALHGKQSDYGFSLYRGVLVQWDEDHDERVLDVLDRFPVNMIERLLIVQEHEGSIAFVWKGKVPAKYKDDDSGVYSPDGDWWAVVSSTAL